MRRGAAEAQHAQPEPADVTPVGQLNTRRSARKTPWVASARPKDQEPRRRLTLPEVQGHDTSERRSGSLRVSRSEPYFAPCAASTPVARMSFRRS